MKKITLLLLLFFGVFTSSYSQTGETCDDAINLGLLTSPISGTTVGALNDNIPSCNGTFPVDTAVDLYYSILVPNGSTLTIAQTVNGYDSEVSVFYGDCTSQTEITCFDDPDTKITVWANDTGSDQTVYWVQDGYNGNSGTYTLAWSVVACTNATATYEVVSDCVNGPQFFVNVDVTDLGSATSMTVSDDQTSPPQDITAAGLLTFGPYANGTSVIIRVSNDQDNACFILSPAQTQATCPPDCANATVIANCGDLVVANMLAGQGSWNVDSCGFTTNGTELVYSFTPTITGIYSLEVTAASGFNYIDYFYKENDGNCENTGWTCIDDNPGTGIDSIGELTEGVQYLFLLDGEGTAAKSQTFKIECPPTCTDATVTYEIVSDCDVAPQFFVNIDVTDMGTATSISIFDDQTSPPQNITEAGLVTFGPYANATPVIFTVANDQDNTCVLTSTPQSQLACPGPNDECSGALPVIVNSDLICTSVTTGTVIGATGSITDNAACFGSEDDDVWFSFVATQTTHQISLNNIAGSTTDMAHSLWTGVDCDNLALVPNTCSDANISSPTDLTIGDTYYIRVYTYTATVGQTSTFDVCVGTFPPTPANDFLCNATVLGIGSAPNGLEFNNYGCTGETNEPVPSCFNDGINGSIWFSFIAPSDAVTITTDIAGATLIDTEIAVYEATGVNCEDMSTLGASIGCDQDSGTVVNYNSILALTGLTTGNNYYIQVDRWGTASNGSFGLVITDNNLATQSFDNASFSYYPNPVKDVLNLSYNKNISKVAVYNLVGQEVVTKSINANQSQIDMSNLSRGTYLVKVTADNQVKTIKVIKE